MQRFPGLKTFFWHVVDVEAEAPVLWSLDVKN